MFFYLQFPFFHFLLLNERKKISGDSWVLGKTLQRHRESFLLPELATGEEQQRSPSVCHRWEKQPRICWYPHVAWFYTAKTVLMAVLETLLSTICLLMFTKSEERKWEDQVPLWFLVQAIFQTPKVWVWMGLERDLSFAFPAMWHSWEKRWGPFLAATLPGGRGDVKAAESSSLPSWPECWKLPRVVAQVCTFIVLVLRAFAWNGESLTEGQMLETCVPLSPGT